MKVFWKRFIGTLVDVIIDLFIRIRGSKNDNDESYK